MRNLKKVIASVLAVALLAALGATSVFAAESPTRGDSVTVKNGGTYVVQKDTTQASWKTSAAQKNATTVTIGKTVKIKGKTLKVTGIKAECLKGCKNVKVIKITSNINKVNKQAFKGISKSRLAKIKIKMKKGSVSKKTFNWLKKKFIKKGFKAKNITWY